MRGVLQFRQAQASACCDQASIAFDLTTAFPDLRNISRCYLLRQGRRRRLSGLGCAIADGGCQGAATIVADAGWLGSEINEALRINGGIALPAFDFLSTSVADGIQQLTSSADVGDHSLPANWRVWA